MSGEVLCDTEILELIKKGVLKNADPSLVSSSGIDLRVGSNKTRLLGETPPLPGQTIEELLKNASIADDYNKKKKDFFVEEGHPYIFELVETINLPNSLTAKIFNKSGRARIGITAKGVFDCVPQYDKIPAGYKGRMYTVMNSTAFPVVVKPGKTTIPQIRFYHGTREPIKGWELEVLLKDKKNPILLNHFNRPIRFSDKEMEEICRTGKIPLTVDLSRELQAYMASEQKKTLDLRKQDLYIPYDFFKEVRSKEKSKVVYIHPGSFTLIMPHERLRIPPTLAAEVIEYSPELGDMKTSYANLINSGHGYKGKHNMTGDHIVGEARARDSPIVLQDRQLLAYIQLLHMSHVPKKSYESSKSTNFDNLPDILPSIFKKN